MYCKNCDLVVHGGSKGQCPLCDGPLEENLLSGSLGKTGNVKGDQKLKDLITDIDATVKKSLEQIDSSSSSGTKSDDFMKKAIQKARADGSRAAPSASGDTETPFDLEKALSAEEIELSDNQSTAAGFGEKPADALVKTRDLSEKKLEEFGPSSGQTKEPYQASRSNSTLTVLIVVFVVVVAAITGYYFSFEEPAAVKKSALLKKSIAPTPAKQARITEKIIETKSPAGEANITLPDKTEPVKAAPPPVQTAIKEKKSAADVPVQKPAQTPLATEPSSSLVKAPIEEKKIAELPRQEKVIPAVFYAVNVGSFKFKESADTVIKDLKKKGYDPSTDSVTRSDKTSWYRVMIGQFKTKDEAQSFAQELESKENIKGFVVKKK